MTGISKSQGTDAFWPIAIKAANRINRSKQKTAPSRLKRPAAEPRPHLPVKAAIARTLGLDSASNEQAV